MLENLKETKDRWKLFDTEEIKTVAHAEALLLKRAREYLDKKGFLEIVVPHIVSATGSCEIIDTLFKLPYFGNEAYLTQTAQLYLEALVPFLGNVWTFGSSFRAEQRVDDRHLTEFSLLELEFEGDFNHMLWMIEDIFCAMVLDFKPNLERPFKRIKYEDAINNLGLTFGMDIRASDEEKLLKSNDNKPFFITHFPKDLKYFNMRVNDEDERVVNSADLILPHGGEAVGSAEREYRPAILMQRLKQSGMWIQYIANGGDPHAFDWYLNLYTKHKPKLHSGFGMGLNRVTKFALDLNDIRQTTIYPVNSATIY